MIAIATREQDLKDIVNALRQEIKVEGSNVIINILSIEPPKPKPITDPRRLLVEKRESMQEFMARVNKDRWRDLREVAEELGVHYNTIRKYCHFGLIEAEGDQYFGGWAVKQSELERIKSNPNWLREFQEAIKNKPMPDKTEIFHRRRVEIMDEIERLHRDHEPLNPKYAMKHYKGLYQRARRYFGGWVIAIKICNIDFSQVYKKFNSPSGFRGRPKMTEERKQLNKEILILRIRSLVSEGKLTTQMKRKLDHPVINYIGGWTRLKYLIDKKPNREVNEGVLPVKDPERQYHYIPDRV